MRRPSTGADDPAELCTGTSARCPTDVAGNDGDGDGVDDASDDCRDVANPDQANADGDALGDECDPCTNVVPVFVTKTRIKLTHQTTPPGDDGLKFSGAMVVPASPAIDFTTHGARVLLTDKSGTNVVDVTIPGGTGWVANPAKTRFRFASTSGVGGITRIRVAQKKIAPGTLRFTVKGKNGAFAVTPAALPLVGTFVVDSPIARTGQCGEAKPACRSIAGGRTVVCR